MRLNRGTIILVVASLLVIAAVLVLNNSRATAPGEANGTATPAPGGPLFTEADPTAIVRLEVRDNTTGERSVFERGDDGQWILLEAETSPSDAMSEAEAAESTPEPEPETTADREPESTDEIAAEPAATIEPTPLPQVLDSAALDLRVNDLVFLNASDIFESDQLEQFGLAAPAYTISAETVDGPQLVVHIGGMNPNRNRYYGVTAESRGELPVTLEGTQTIFLLPSTSVNLLINLIRTPPFTVSFEQQQLDQMALIEEMLASVEQATAEAAPEATDDAAPTEEVIPEAEATEEVST
ncbi:MAG: hypothetical protein SNJ59_12175 [Aggregatilineales bacterium]